MGNENNVHCKWAVKQYARETKLTGRKQFNELFIICNKREQHQLVVRVNPTGPPDLKHQTIAAFPDIDGFVQLVLILHCIPIDISGHLDLHVLQCKFVSDCVY